MRRHHGTTDRGADGAASAPAAASAPSAPSDPSVPSVTAETSEQTTLGAHAARAENSAGGVVFRLDHGQPFFLLIRDSYQNWGFPKGHIEAGERPDAAAMREVTEETGLAALSVRGAIETIDWYFRFRGQLIHKFCQFYLIETAESRTCPQRAEGITACRWTRFDEAESLVSYDNARLVLRRAQEMVNEFSASA